MKCENCETEFEQRHGSQKYCSTKCSKKAHYQRNKEQILESTKKWQRENKEKLREYKKKHYNKNKEQIQERKKEYYQKNKEYFNEYHKRILKERRNAWKLNSEEEQLKIMQDFTKKELERLRNEQKQKIYKE